MTTLTLEIPKEVEDYFDLANKEFLKEIFTLGLLKKKIMTAINFYKQGGMSLGYVAELFNVPEDELIKEAYLFNIEPPYSEQTLREEVGSI